jgi:hypothetical protein
MNGFRKKSLPAMAPAGLPRMERIGVATLAEQLPYLGLTVFEAVCRDGWRVFLIGNLLC